MCWNSVGSITSRDEGGVVASIEIDFNDKNRHRAVRFSDRMELVLGSLSDQVRSGIFRHLSVSMSFQWDLDLSPSGSPLGCPFR